MLFDHPTREKRQEEVVPSVPAVLSVPGQLADATGKSGLE